MFANGNSFGSSAASVKVEDFTAWAVPTWKFGISPQSMIGTSYQLDH